MHNGLGLLIPVSNKDRQAFEGMATGQSYLGSPSAEALFSGNSGLWHGDI